MFQALGSWGRGKKGEREKKRGRTKVLVLSRFCSSQTTKSLEEASFD